jgi:hypothetical protein
VAVDKPTVTANGADSVTVTVFVGDQHGNAISGSVVAVEATGSSNSILPPAGLSLSDGRMIAKVRSTKAELKTISARVGGVLVTNTRNVTFVPGPFSAAQSDVAISPSTVVANGTDTTVVTVTVKDAQGNPIQGSSVTIESTGGPNTIRQPVGVTGSNGVAVGSVKSTKAELKTITGRVGGVAISTTRVASFVAGPFSPSVSTVAANPSSVVANGVDTTVVTVTVKDAQGNPIQGSVVTIESTGGPNTIRQPVGVTGSNGVAVGSVKSTKAEAKVITAKVGVVAIVTTPGVTFTAGPERP